TLRQVMMPNCAFRQDMFPNDSISCFSSFCPVSLQRGNQRQVMLPVSVRTWFQSQLCVTQSIKWSIRSVYGFLGKFPQRVFMPLTTKPPTLAKKCCSCSASSSAFQLYSLFSK